MTELEAVQKYYDMPTADLERERIELSEHLRALDEDMRTSARMPPDSDFDLRAELRIRIGRAGLELNRRKGGTQ